MTTGFLDLSLGLQTALACGYLAYATAYAGLRRGHAARDAVFISLAFSVIALLVFGLVDGVGDIARVAAALTVTLAAGALWRNPGRRWWRGAMEKTRVHREDGMHAAWDAIAQTDREVGQISVYLNDGRVLFMQDRRQFAAAPWGGLYFGGDGGVIMAVEGEELPDGSEEKRAAVLDDDWGARMSYIPASEIARVDIRMK